MIMRVVQKMTRRMQTEFQNQKDDTEKNFKVWVGNYKRGSRKTLI
jgi:hypothetical protein